MAKFDIFEGVTYFDRKGWGAREDIPRLGFYVSRTDRTHVIIHHTVIADPDATPNLWETEDEVISKMKQLQMIRPDLGLDVPYNFVVFLMNTDPKTICVCEGRGEDRTGAHTKGHNTTGIGVSIQGNFEFEVNIKDWTPLISRFLGWLKYDPNGPGYGGPYSPMSNLGQLKPEGRHVFGHRDFKATACPGESVWTVIEEFNFTRPN